MICLNKYTFNIIHKKNPQDIMAFPLKYHDCLKIARKIVSPYIINVNNRFLFISV